MKKIVWEKFLGVNSVAGVCCLLRQPLGPVRSDPVTRVLLRSCLVETWEVGNAMRVGLEESAIKAVLDWADSLPPDAKPSMLRDLENGNQLELDIFQGAVIRLGEKLGVSTPVNKIIHAALTLYAHGKP
ncbi:MAG: hypothetical protein IIA14_03925 [SAR324 cluster bacterium]|nr:hypothetical protein [SAR324 cluster bacterium]